MVIQVGYSMQQLQKEVKELKKEIRIMQTLMFVPNLRVLKSLKKRAIILRGSLKGAKINEKDFESVKQLLFKHAG